MIDIPINETITVPSTSTLVITQGRVNFLHLDLDNTCAYMKISYLDGTGVVVSTRYFKVMGMTYGALISQSVTGNLAEIVIGLTAQFAMTLLATPAMIDGKEVVELNKQMFLGALIK